VDGDSLTYTVVQPPANGTLSGTAPNLTYEPAADYYGPDSFTFQVTDSSGVTSNMATVSLTVQPVDDIPVAQSQSVSTDEGTPVAITLVGTDVEGDSLTYTVVQPPANGTLSGTAPNLTYQPAANYHGPDSFTFQVTDSSGVTSNVATISLTVRSINDAPVALAQSVSTDEDIPVSITLVGTDIDGDSLTYTVVQQPTHGTLSGTLPNLTYQPAANYHGPDSFTFQVTDSSGVTSNVATVSLTVRSINDAPVALAQSVSTDEDIPVSITLMGTDVDGDSLTYTVVQPPAHGTLSGAFPNLTYLPAANYNGPDSFTFQVNDGQVDSNPSTISITVQPFDDAPVAVAQSVTLDEDSSPVSITLVGTDADGDNSLTYTVVQQPTHGTLSGTLPDLTYQPAANYHGPDSFTFQVTDSSGVTSNVATVSLTVRSVNDAPVALAKSVSTSEDIQLLIIQEGTDVDGDSLTYTVVQPPSMGTLSGTGSKINYKPAPNAYGSDSFTFKVTDTAGATSNVATVSITVTSVNDYPVAIDQSVSTDQDTPVPITLTGTDVEGDPLRFRIAYPPKNGTVSGTPPNYIYQPAAGFSGTDSFTFRCHDGKVDSNLGTVTITVRSITGSQVATAQSVSTDEGTPVSITLPGTSDGPQAVISASTLKPTEGEVVLFSSMVEELGGGPLTYAWSFGDGSTSEQPNPSHAYANEGSHEVVLVVSNGEESERAVLTLEVLNGAPVLVPLDVPAVAEENKPITFQASAFDPGAADTHSFSWDFGDGSPVVMGARVTHAYADDGTYTVTVTGRDDAHASTRASRQVRVSNLPPQAEPVAPQSTQTGQEVRIQLRATDVASEMDPLSWSLVEGPGSLTPEGLYSWTPPSGTMGEFVVRAQVSDEGGSSQLLFRITVTSGDTSVPPASCGCTGSGEAVSFVALLLVALASRSRRRSSSRTFVPSSN
jgi:large repetitive protein